MRASLRICLAVWLLALAAAVAAQELPAGSESLYQGEVPVTKQGAGERAAAIQRALAQVVIKLTGDPEAARNPLVARQLRSAASLEQGHRYRQDMETAPNGAPIYRQTLIVDFNRNAIDALIAASGLPVWPAPRTPTKLWLAIDDGRGARVVGAQQINVTRSLTRRAAERGLVLEPSPAGAVEQIGADAIWGFDAGALAGLVSRYGADNALVGKLYRTALGWNADWLLLADGVELDRWSTSDVDARRALAAGADGAAGALAKRFAKVMPSGPPAIVTVEVQGVDGAGDYLRLMGYLQTLAVVRSIVPVEASPERLRLSLDLATGLEGFQALIDGGQTLAALEGSVGDPVFLLQR